MRLSLFICSWFHRVWQVHRTTTTARAAAQPRVSNCSIQNIKTLCSIAQKEHYRHDSDVEQATPVCRMVQGLTKRSNPTLPRIHSSSTPRACRGSPLRLNTRIITAAAQLGIETDKKDHKGSLCSPATHGCVQGLLAIGSAKSQLLTVFCWSRSGKTVAYCCKCKGRGLDTAN